MATKKTYNEARDLSKLSPNQVMDMILHDPKIDDNTFRSIAIMAGATIEDIFMMDSTSKIAVPRKKEELVSQMRNQQNKPSGLRVTPLLGLVSTGAIAWYLNHLVSQHDQSLTRRKSSSKTRTRKRGGMLGEEINGDVFFSSEDKEGTEGEEREGRADGLFRRVSNWATSVREQLGNYLNDAANNAVGTVKDACEAHKNVANITNKANEHAEKTKGTPSTLELVKDITGNVSSILDNAEKVDEYATEYGNRAGTAIKNYANETKEAVTDMGTQAKNNLTEIGTNAANRIEGYANETKRNVETWSENTNNAIKGYGNETKKTVETWSDNTKNTIEKYAKNTRNALIFSGIAIGLYAITTRLWDHSEFHHKQKMKKEARKSKMDMHKKKMQLEKEHQIQLYQYKQQQSMLYKGYNLVKGLSQYQQQLKIVPLFVSVVLAYSTMKSFAAKKKQKSIFNALFYKDSPEPKEAVPLYAGNLKSINSNLHRCFESHPHPTKSSEQNENMQKLMYCLIKQNQKKWFQKNVHLHVSHFVLPSGHLRQSPASVANTIVKNRKLYEYLFTVPMMLSNFGSSVVRLFTRKRKRKHSALSKKTGGGGVITGITNLGDYGKFEANGILNREDGYGNITRTEEEGKYTQWKNMLRVSYNADMFTKYHFYRKGNPKWKDGTITHNRVIYTLVPKSR